MAKSKINTSTLLSSATHASVSRVQANPISVRRPGEQVAPVAEHVPAQAQTAEIPVPSPTRLLVAGRQAAPAYEPQIQQVQAAPVQSTSPSQEAPQQVQPAVTGPSRPSLLTSMGEPVQTPETMAMDVVPAGGAVDPEIAAFDAAHTSVAGVPYYSLSQIVKNYKLAQPDMPADITVPAVEDIPEPGEVQQTARYGNEEKIGEGGTSLVYKAHDTRLRRKVALKRFKDISRSNEESDYLNELEAASRISHPYVVSAYDADKDSTSRYIVMEHIDGMDMEKAISKYDLSFDLNRFINFAHRALEGLEATHQAGLLHLDLKPSNIMLCVRDNAPDIIKLIDFGRARAAVSEDGKAPRGLGLNGSIFYSAPEQLLSEDLDVRTDLYSLGCIFYWVLAKRRPYDGANPVSIMSTHLQHLVTDISDIIPTLPQWLSEWIMRLIALEKRDRPPSAQLALDELIKQGDHTKVTQFQA